MGTGDNRNGVNLDIVHSFSNIHYGFVGIIGSQSLGIKDEPLSLFKSDLKHEFQLGTYLKVVSLVGSESLYVEGLL